MDALLHALVAQQAASSAPNTSQPGPSSSNHNNVTPANFLLQQFANGNSQSHQLMAYQNMLNMQLQQQQMIMLMQNSGMNIQQLAMQAMLNNLKQNISKESMQQALMERLSANVDAARPVTKARKSTTPKRFVPQESPIKSPQKEKLGAVDDLCKPHILHTDLPHDENRKERFVATAPSDNQLEPGELPKPQPQTSQTQQATQQSNHPVFNQLAEALKTALANSAAQARTNNVAQPQLSPQQIAALQLVEAWKNVVNLPNGMTQQQATQIFQAKLLLVQQQINSTFQPTSRKRRAPSKTARPAKAPRRGGAEIPGITPQQLLALQQMHAAQAAKMAESQQLMLHAQPMELGERDVAAPGPYEAQAPEATKTASPGTVRARKHIVTDIEAVRKAFDLGWIRQTTVRSIAANGIRGEVHYFTPCGRKLATYAEILRYLARHSKSSDGISRDNFSFSCKMIIGEYIYINGENNVKKMSEDEIRLEIERLRQEKAEKEKKPDRKPKERKIREPKFRLPRVKKEKSDENGRTTPSDDAKGSRAPIEDLQLREIRSLPPLRRLENVSMNGVAFANALMVFDFLQNFHEILDIDVSVLLTLDDLCAGVCGDERHFGAVVKLTQKLISCLAIFVGLSRGTTFQFMQNAGELTVTAENYSEILRLFLENRDPQSKELSQKLVRCNFEELCGEDKIELLAHICNELVSCRKVARCLDRQMAELSRLRGERWMRDGKVRVLRNVKKLKQENSTNIDVAAHLKKTYTPGIGRCDVLTKEEEEMSVDDLTKRISQMGEESEQIKEQYNILSKKVRILPTGQDRYFRYYWQLPSVPSVLVEGTESSLRFNNNVNLQELTGDPPSIAEPKEYMDPDVIATLENLVDKVCLPEEFPTDVRRLKKGPRLVKTFAKKGWWSLDEATVKPLCDSLHGRGNRERLLHRVLLRDNFVKESKFEPVVLSKIENMMDIKTYTNDHLVKTSQFIQSLEFSVYDAGLSVPEYKPVASKEDAKNVSLESLKERLMLLQCSIKSAFFREHFRASDPVPLMKVLREEAKKKREKQLALQQQSNSYQPDDGLVNTEESTKQNVDLEPVWKEATKATQTTAGLYVCAEVLKECIAFEKSSVKPLCQICRCQANGRSGISCIDCRLCYHLACFKPTLSVSSKDSWICPKCVEKNTSKPTCMLCNHQNSPIFGCRKCCNYFHVSCADENIPPVPSEYLCNKCDIYKRMPHLAVEDMPGCPEFKVPRLPARRRTNSRRHQAVKAPPKRSTTSEIIVFPIPMVADLARVMLDEFEQQPDSAPFMEPVTEDVAPGYLDVIDNPIDLQTIRDRVEEGKYETAEQFHADCELMFENCRTFNEDDSPTGIAGVHLYKWFCKRWRQVRYNFCKRLKRLRPVSII